MVVHTFDLPCLSYGGLPMYVHVLRVHVCMYVYVCIWLDMYVFDSTECVVQTVKGMKSSDCQDEGRWSALLVRPL